MRARWPDDDRSTTEPVRALAIRSLLLAVMALLAAPGWASAQKIPRLYEVRVTGSTDVRWELRSGPVGETCQDWRHARGWAKQTFNPKQPLSLTVAGDRISAMGTGKATIKGRVEDTVAYLTEPACPAVCADAAVAVDGRRGNRPLDCTQVPTPRKEIAASCESGARVSSLFTLRGFPQISVRTTILGTVLPVADDCLRRSGDIPPVEFLTAKQLQGIGRGKSLTKKRRTTGECAGAKLLRRGLGSRGTYTCTWKHQVRVAIKRIV